VLTRINNCWQPRAGRKRQNARSIGGNKSIDYNIEGVVVFFERLKRWGDFLRLPDCKPGDVNT
jgi:hypothetical protein